MGNNNKRVIKGTVAQGFESVQVLYERNMNNLAEEYSQLCVYHKGEKVVDLWAQGEDTNEFSADSLINVFSSGKSLESIALATLVDKGLLRFDEKIVHYWPEFGAHGKAGLTIADLMRHEAGLANFTTSIEPADLQTEHLKQNKIGSIVERQPLGYPGDGTQSREYHAVSRGWVVNEIFRRIDPLGRTLGEFLQQDINEPLGVEARVGLGKDELSRVHKVRHRGFAFELLESLKPKFLGRRVPHSLFRLLSRILRILPKARKRMTRGAPVPYTGMDGILFFNEESVALGETPSANTKSSARTLAKIAAMMSAGGHFSGHEYLGQGAWDAMHAHPTEELMGGAIPTRFTQGGVNQFLESSDSSSVLEQDFNTGREGFFGWMGLGGSIFQWNPKLDIGFGYTVTELHVLDFLNERGKVYQAQVMGCIREMEKQQHAPRG